LLSIFFQNGTADEFEIFSITARKIWLRRNEWIHEGLFTHPNSLVLGAQQNQSDFHLINKMEGGDPQQGEEICWKCPQVGCFKMNCDAALDMEGRRMGMGIILRNHEGKVRAAWSLSKPGLLEPAAAEAVALFHGMKFCKELGISNLSS
jgi:hypothetical protein